MRNIIFDLGGVVLPNIEAAQAIGLHTVLFRDAGQCELELEPLLAGE